jgi:hypothetical protein
MSESQEKPRTPEEQAIYEKVLGWLQATTIGDKDEECHVDSPRGKICVAVRKADPSNASNEGGWPYDFCVSWSADLKGEMGSLGDYGPAEYVAKYAVWFFRYAEPLGPPSLDRHQTVGGWRVEESAEPNILNITAPVDGYAEMRVVVAQVNRAFNPAFYGVPIDPDANAVFIAATPAMAARLTRAAEWFVRAADLLEEYDPHEADLFREDANGIRELLRHAGVGA